MMECELAGAMPLPSGALGRSPYYMYIMAMGRALEFVAVGRHLSDAIPTTFWAVVLTETKRGNVTEETPGKLGHVSGELKRRKRSPSGTL